MKNIVILISLGILLLYSYCNSESQVKGKENVNAKASVIALTNETFKQKVYNYDANKEWKFEGKEPVIIDFYADWCGPCRQLSPIVEEIAKEYEGKISVYKVNTDAERQLAESMGISSLPTLLFIPAKGQPQASMGALPKEELVKIIKEVLQVN
jgi:thioredoxin 1